MAGRFIKLYDKILKWEWYGDINTFRLFIHLLLKANYKDVSFKGQRILRGQLVTSLTRMAAETSLTVRQVRDSLDKLKMTGEVTSKGYNKYSVITIVRYDEYQANDTQNGKQTTRKTANKRQANDTQTDTQTVIQTTRETATSIEYIENIEDRNIDYLTRERTASRFVPPTKEELFDYCLENQLGVDVDRFYNYYVSNGWRVGRNPMKDWRAALKSWWSKDKKEQPSRPAGKTVAAQQYTQRDYSSEDEAALRRMLEEV